MGVVVGGAVVLVAVIATVDVVVIAVVGDYTLLNWRPRVNMVMVMMVTI